MLSKVYEAQKEQEWSKITLENLKHILKKSSKRKLPGKDKIRSFCLNVFHETHTRLTQLYNLITTDPNLNGLSTASATYYLNLMILIIPKTI